MSVLCDVMANSSIPEPLDRLSLLSKSNELFDSDISFQDYVTLLSNVTIDPELGGNGERERGEIMSGPWDYYSTYNIIYCFEC